MVAKDFSQISRLMSGGGWRQNVWTIVDADTRRISHESDIFRAIQSS